MKLIILICMLIIVTISCTFADDNDDLWPWQQIDSSKYAAIVKESREINNAYYADMNISSKEKINVKVVTKDSVFTQAKLSITDVKYVKDLANIVNHQAYSETKSIEYPSRVSNSLVFSTRVDSISDEDIYCEILVPSSYDFVVVFTEMITNKTTEYHGPNAGGGKHFPAVLKPGKYMEETYVFPVSAFPDAAEYSVNIARIVYNPKSINGHGYIVSDKPIIVKTIKNQKDEIQITKITLPKPITAK